MLIVEKNKINLHLPVLQRCLLDPCNLYRFILQNSCTKRVFVYRIQALLGNTKVSNFRLCFRFEVAECMDEGEYTYYLVSDDNWINPENIDINSVKSSVKWTDKGAILYDDMLLVANNKLVVTGKYKAIVFNKDELLIGNVDGCVTDEKQMFLVNSRSEDENVVSDILKQLNILGAGLLKYNRAKDFCCDESNYEQFVAEDIHYDQFKAKEEIYEEA